MIPTIGRHLVEAAPLIPDRDEAREWAERELSDPVYQAAEPTPVDRIARAVGEFFVNLFNPDLSGGWGPAFALVAAVVVVIVVVAAFLVWGVPRASGRAAARTGELFGEPEGRSATELRRAAEAHAGRGEWEQAIIVRVRAIARSCVERGVVDTPPGATVHAFARAAGRVFPDSADELERAATAFDDVRYLRRPGSAELYRRVSTVDDAVRDARPAPKDAVPA
ncbi:hypothetical protein JOD63_001919 [Microbacterium terrae]|uniref:Protein-glutamine gamma-glutamyltransferase-like C-terminal domain-containing protein n=1 Tax=Microbacterium terrae TaxID=69369 RepID=A0A0M2HCC3_9MICO|nr:DUF4129 domain-containing protein [Microbacterium terrae]KJL41758.1 hypothetical protein RS81_01343 [Microbacterium terrae]MBP1077951.1 hypothetical protein [Microbacterium terrae]GLK00123.1 hypothetical protein GCM10017594_33200 [Microbacterium terrae]